MLKSLKKFRPSAPSEDEALPADTDLEPAGDSQALVEPDAANTRSRVIGTLQILLVVLLMAAEWLRHSCLARKEYGSVRHFWHQKKQISLIFKNRPLLIPLKKALRYRVL